MLFPLPEDVILERHFCQMGGKMYIYTYIYRERERGKTEYNEMQYVKMGFIQARYFLSSGWKHLKAEN